MTVKELIEELQTKPLTYEVWSNDDGLPHPAVEVAVDHDKQRVMIW